MNFFKAFLQQRFRWFKWLLSDWHCLKIPNKSNKRATPSLTLQPPQINLRLMFYISLFLASLTVADLLLLLIYVPLQIWKQVPARRNTMSQYGCPPKISLGSIQEGLPLSGPLEFNPNLIRILGSKKDLHLKNFIYPQNQLTQYIMLYRAHEAQPSNLLFRFFLSISFFL